MQVERNGRWRTDTAMSMLATKTPIIDAHLHLWDPHVFSYGWVESDPILNRPFNAASFTEVSTDFDIAGAVFVQCDAHDALAEVAWVSEQAQMENRIQGIVAFAPLDQGAAARGHLDSLATNALVKGVRRNLQSAAHDVFCDDDFIAGVQSLADYHYSFDLCIRSHHLPDAITLVKACPKVTFILNHMAKPPVRTQQLDPWRQHMSELATLPNIVCKMSGIVTEALPESWSLTDLSPYVEHVLASFGPARIIWGSDWPVVLTATDYRQWVDATHMLLAPLDDASRRCLLHDNARAIYRLT